MDMPCVCLLFSILAHGVQEKCPVKINTGDLIKSLRAEAMKSEKTSSATAECVLA